MATLPSISEDSEDVQFAQVSPPPVVPTGGQVGNWHIPDIVITCVDGEEITAGEDGQNVDQVNEDGDEVFIEDEEHEDRTEKGQQDGIRGPIDSEKSANDVLNSEPDEAEIVEEKCVDEGRNKDKMSVQDQIVKHDSQSSDFTDKDEKMENEVSGQMNQMTRGSGASYVDSHSDVITSSDLDKAVSINGQSACLRCSDGRCLPEGTSEGGLSSPDSNSSKDLLKDGSTEGIVKPSGQEYEDEVESRVNKSGAESPTSVMGLMQQIVSDARTSGHNSDVIQADGCENSTECPKKHIHLDTSPASLDPDNGTRELADLESGVLDQSLSSSTVLENCQMESDEKRLLPSRDVDETLMAEGEVVGCCDKLSTMQHSSDADVDVVMPKVTCYVEMINGEWTTTDKGSGDPEESLLILTSVTTEQDSFNEASVYPGYRKLHPTGRVVPPDEWQQYCKHRVLPPGGWEELMRSRGFLDRASDMMMVPPRHTIRIAQDARQPVVPCTGPEFYGNNNNDINYEDVQNVHNSQPQNNNTIVPDETLDNGIYPVVSDVCSPVTRTDQCYHQITVSDRPTLIIPNLSKRLGSLSKESKPEKDAKDDNEGKTEMSTATDELALTKQVIIHRDERGYGLSVSGDNPVFVRSVKENGPAAKAGIQVGDRILKVNGTLVTKFNHGEVVKLIKSGSYVALTLLGRPSGQQMSSTPTQSSGSPAQMSSVTSQLPPPYPSHDGSPVNIVLPSAGARGDERSQSSSHSAGQRSDERTPISGPTAVDAQTDKELKMQKISMIRFMYEQACEECQKLAEELKNTSGSVSAQIQNKLDEKRRVCERLGDQLYLLTGIPTESHISSPKSPPSGLPPPGGTFASAPGSQRPPLKRYSSGDGLNNIQENKENVNVVENPAPWLPGGPKHRKAESMPESVLSDDFSLDNSKEITVSRSNSDSDKRPKTGRSEDIREACGTASADEIEKLTTSSLPSNVYESTNNNDTPTNQSGMGMMSPSQQTREAWEESADMSYSSELQESLNMTKVSGGSFSPPREVGGRILHAVSPLQADIIPMEEEEEVNIEDDHLDDHGPFSDLNRLKHKPAHLAVFLHYLISNSDPSPLLFYLVTEHYPHGSIKELRRWAYEIYSTFLVPTAVIKVEDIDSSLLDNIEQTLLHRSDKEDAMRTIFQNARHMAQKQISELLADFRQKRTLGLANLYGDNELSDNMDRAAELKTVENKLLKHLMAFTRDPEKATPRDKAMASALATIMKQLGANIPKTSPVLERCPTFISKDKKIFKLGGRSIKKNGHQFIPNHYHSTTYCNYCRAILWGIGYQGFQCSNCDINVHKACMDQMQDHCTGRRKKEKRTSMLNMLRKTTNPNPAAIREAQRLHEEKLANQRALSMPSIRDSTATMWRSSSSFSTQHINSCRASRRSQVTIEEDIDSNEALRAGNKVSSLVEQYSQLQHTTDDAKSPTTPPRGRSPETMEMEDQNDLQVDDQTLKSLNQSGSSSNSSLSNRSLDSPSTSAEALSDAHHMASNLTALQDDSDVEVEPELPPLEASIPKEALKKLRKSEKKRQDVINELFYTERTHVRDLKIMQRLFCIPMMNLFNDPELVSTLFPGLEDLIEVHRKLNIKFKNAKKESPVVKKVAELLLSSWEGEEGEEFKRSCATFCRDQSHALDYLRMRQRKDQKLASFLQEAQSNPLCRRLGLKDLIPQAMQRLTKYPLFIETLLKHTPGMSEEHILLQKALDHARKILDHVNQAVKDRENEHKLADFQRHLDIRVLDSKYQNFDLRQYKLIHDGLLTWRITKQKQIQMHVLLLDELLVLLQKQDDRLILKYHSTARDDNNKSTHSPIISLNNLMVRPVATDKYSMFLISDGEFGPQIYELQSRSTEAIKRWFKYLSEGTSDSRQKKQKSNDAISSLPPRPASMVVPDTSSHMENETHTDQNKQDTKSESSLFSKPSKSQSLDSLEKLDHVEVHSVVEPPLAHPSDVVAKSVVVNTAPPVQSPHERLKEKDGIIKSALQEKRSILAELYKIPPEEFTTITDMAAEVEGDKEPREILLASFHQTEQLTCLINKSLSHTPGGDIADLVSPSSTSEPGPSSGDVKNNDTGVCEGSGEGSRTLSVTEAEPQCGEAGPPDVNHKDSSDSGDAGDMDKDGDGSTSENIVKVSKKPNAKSKDFCISIPSGKLLAITSKLNAQLHHLMEAITAREKEQERLQQELKSAQEQIASLLGSQKSQSVSDSVSPTSRPNSYISVTSSASEVGEASEEQDAVTESPSLVSSVSSSQVTTSTVESSSKASAMQAGSSSVTEAKSIAAWTLNYILDGDTFDDAPSESTAGAETVTEPEKHTEDVSEVVLEIHEENDDDEACKEKEEAPLSDVLKPQEERNSDGDDSEDDFVDANAEISNDRVEVVSKDAVTGDMNDEQETDTKQTTTDGTPEAEPSNNMTDSSGVAPEQEVNESSSKPALEEEKVAAPEEEPAADADPKSDVTNESCP